MNKLTKPISSPGRTDKFPPPLMRFLRSNVGNKSRRRSRASPMFVKKKNAVIETTQEPSSPKVTCIGQVRVRRLKNKKTTVATTVNHRQRHRHRRRLCRWFRKLKPKSFITVWSKWVSFFRCGCCENSGERHDSPAKTPSPINAGDNGERQEDEDEDVRLDEGDDINQGLMQRSLPTNALLLTRCRSAPYRSSSLGSIFEELTMVKTGEGEVAEGLKDLKVESTMGKTGGDEAAEGLKDLSVESTMVKTGEEEIAEELKNLKVELTMGKTGEVEVSEELKNLKDESTMEKSGGDEVSDSLKDLSVESTMVKTGDDEVAEELKNLKVESTMVKTGEDEVAEGLKDLKVELTMGKTGDDEVAEELMDLKVESESINGGEESKLVKASPLILSRCKSEPARRWDQLLKEV